MAYGHGGVGLQEQHAHRFADGVAAADHDGMLAAQVDAGGFDQLHAAIRRARTKALKAGHQFAGRQHRVAVDVLGGRDGLDDFGWIDVLRQRHLHQDAVDRRVHVQCCNAIEQGCFTQVGVVFLEHRMETHVATGLDLVAHIDLAGLVFADQDHGQAGLLAGGGQGGGALGDVFAQLFGKENSVDQLCRHGLGSSLGKTGIIRPTHAISSVRPINPPFFAANQALRYTMSVDRKSNLSL